MRMMFLLLALGGCIGGCGYANPGTTLRIDPLDRSIYFYDTKDNDITVKNLDVNPDTRAIHVDEVVIRNNASDVREANVQQMLAVAEQQRAFNEGLAQLRAMIGDVAGLLRGSAANISTPWGIGANVNLGTQPAK